MFENMHQCNIFRFMISINTSCIRVEVTIRSFLYFGLAYNTEFFYP